MTIDYCIIPKKTETWQTFIDITEEVQNCIPASAKVGSVLVYCRHTTSGVRILENEPLLIKDLEMFMERLAPKTITYLHDDLSKRQVPPHERINGHSHLKSLLINSSETIPIIDGKLQMGQWQRIFFIEFDPGRDRELTIMVHYEI